MFKTIDYLSHLTIKSGNSFLSKMSLEKFSKLSQYEVNDCQGLDAENYDGVVYVAAPTQSVPTELSLLKPHLQTMFEIDASFKERGGIAPANQDIAGRRIIFAPTGLLSRDYDDIRRYMDAACLGTKRWVCRDLAGSDPERMCPEEFEKYVSSVFAHSNIHVRIISDAHQLNKEFPLFQRVNRGSEGKHSHSETRFEDVSPAKRHKGRIILLEYHGEGPIDTSLFLVGKGVTYDTGGHDIKAGGIMAGMHRDKCGAAAVVGFFKILSTLKPQGIKVTGGLAVVRNCVSAEAYVADELVTSRAGVRVRVGNTDAEGRMAMADLVCMFKEIACTSPNPHIITVATLTGHARLAVGVGYSILLNNGPACSENFGSILQKAGDQIGDPIELSTIRREDYELIKGKSEYEDILQSNNVPSSRTPRGHQYPAAFLILASGLDQHGLDSNKPIKFSHMDIAASSGPFPGVPTAAPLLALCSHFLVNRQ